MRINKRTVGLLLLLMVAILLAAGVAGISSQSQGTSASAKPDDATPVQEGKMTDKQREHSKLYKGYGDGKKLKDVAVQIRGGVKAKREVPLQGGETTPAPNFSEFLRGLVCSAVRSLSR